MIGGHGHVKPRPDGMKARCGGPALCTACAKELAELRGDKTYPVRLKRRDVPTLDQWVEEQGLTDLRAEIECHCEQYVEDAKDVPTLARLIMISLRQKWEAK